MRAGRGGISGLFDLSSETMPVRLWRAVVVLIACVPQSASAQRAAVPEDFVGLTHCDSGRAVTRMRADIRDTLVRAQLEAHESVHRAQAGKFATCEAFTASVASARQIIDVEVPADCAQWRGAVAEGVDTMGMGRGYALRCCDEEWAVRTR